MLYIVIGIAGGALIGSALGVMSYALHVMRELDKHL